MAGILEKITSYLFIILIGYVLRRKGMFKKEDARKLGVIIVNITLPAALIRNAGSIVIGPALPILAGFAILASIVTLLAGFLMGKRKRCPKTSALMLTTSTYNIGAFLLPFVEALFPGTGVMYLCMFDSGNAIMGLGISYALAKAASSPDRKLTLGNIFNTLLHSVPFMTYLILFLLALLHVQLPDLVIRYANVIGNANAFLTMFMIGLLVDFSLPAEQMKEILKTTAVRYGINLALCLVVLILPGLNPLARLICTLCLMAPVASAAVVYSMECGYKGDLVGMVSTFSMIVSVAAITILILVFGQGFAIV